MSRHTASSSIPHNDTVHGATHAEFIRLSSHSLEVDPDRTINSVTPPDDVGIAFFDPDATQGLSTDRNNSDAVIMLVDDEPTTLDVVQILLEDAGYSQFVTTSDSTSAMELLEQSRPDLVLLDLNMPNVDGFDILATIRMDRSLARIPVVILTSSDDASTRLDALELGATDFLAKPVDASELVLRVRNNLAVKAYQDRIRRERQKSEQLLLNILPRPVAERLKAGEKTIADYFEDATVLFADIANFTDYASETDATKLVQRLNELFYAFDELVASKGLEKIKTVGDAYILAGGLPVPSPDHAATVVETGLEMLQVMEDHNRGRETKFAMRIGIHTGALVAGVIGRSKFSYDLWGDTVNVASRMETHGLPGCIQISESTRRVIGPQFLIEPRGQVVIKGKGAMTTYLVKGQIDLDPFDGQGLSRDNE